MKAKLYKVLDQYHLYDGDKAIATTIVGNPMLLPNLSKQNCDEIFGVVDVEKLTQDSYQKYSAHDNKISLDEQIQRSGGFIVGFKEGFNKAMELNRFTLEDIKRAISFGQGMDLWKEEEQIDKFIQSLQQPKEIDVVIVTECPQCQEWGYVSECRKDCNKKFLQPKLDSERQLIIKKI
jgi:hypothetical protein